MLDDDRSRAFRVGHVPRFFDRNTLRLLLLTLFVCTSFAAAASWTLWLRIVTAETFSEPGTTWRLGVKGFVFGIGTALLLAWLIRLPRPVLAAPRRAAQGTPGRGTTTCLLTTLAIAALLVFPNLESYPWAAPDEMHHLIVARNVAEHGAYASGHPEDGLHYFDHYDSVGPTVVLPIAAMFELSGKTLTSARIVLGVYYLTFCVLVFALLRRDYGDVRAATAVLFATMSFGSVYLGRSVYGEVPAMAFLVASLLLWRSAMAGTMPVRFGVAAGCCAGLAVLTKAFILLAVFPLLGVLVHDRLTHRSVRWPALAYPAAGFLGAVSAWEMVKVFHGGAVGSNESLILYYRHYLMFGLESAPEAGLWLLKHPATVLVWLPVLIWTGRRIVTTSYDPALAVLYLTALLFLFWWLFFTPGTIPRYLWYTAAIGAMFGGIAIVDAVAALAGTGRKPIERAGWACAATALAAVLVLETVTRIDEVYFREEAGDEPSLAAFLDRQPANVRIATTYWPVQRSMNFFAGRKVDVIEITGENSRYDIIIVNRESGECEIPGFDAESTAFGRYIVLLPRGRAHGT